MRREQSTTKSQNFFNNRAGPWLIATMVNNDNNNLRCKPSEAPLSSTRVASLRAPAPPAAAPC